MIWCVLPEDVPGAKNDILSFSYVIPISETTAVLVRSGTLAYVDIEKQEIISLIRIPSFYSSSILTYAIHDTTLAIPSNDGSIYIYDLSTEKKITTLSLNERFNIANTDYSIESLSFNTDGSQLAIGTSYKYTNISSTTDPEQEKANEILSNEYFSEHPACSLMIYSLNEDTLTPLSTTMTSNVLFLNNTQLAAIHYTKKANIAISDGLSENMAYSYYLEIYDINTGEGKLKSDEYNNLSNTPIMILDKELICCFKETLLIIDPETLSTMLTYSFDSPIVGISHLDEKNFFIATENGSVLQLTISSDYYLMHIFLFTVNDTVSSSIYNAKYDTIIQVTEDNIVFSQQTQDLNMKIFPTDELTASGHTINSVDYLNVQDQTYCCINYSSDINGIKLYSSGFDKLLFEFETDQAEDAINNFSIGMFNHNPYLCFCVTTVTEITYFYKVDLSTGNIIIKEDVTHYDTLSFDSRLSVIYSFDMTWLLVERKTGAVLFDISGDSIIPREHAIFANKSLSRMFVSSDNHYLVLLGSNNLIYLYDLEKDCPIDATIEHSSTCTRTVMGRNESIFATYDDSGQINVYNCVDGALLQTIPSPISNNLDFAFFNNDQYLIVSDSINITLWDLKTQKPTMKYTRENPNIGYTLIVGKNNHYFALKMYHNITISPNNMILNKRLLSLFYVDDNNQFYPFADVDYGTVNLSTEEICVQRKETIAYSSFYDYKQLKEMALDVLDNKTLTDAEKREYFLTD